MSRYSYTGVARSGSGKVIQGAIVTLLLAGTDTAATFYDSSTEGSVTSVASDESGQFVLFVSDEDYTPDQQFKVKAQYPGGVFSSNVVDNIQMIPIGASPNTYYPDAAAADQGVTGDSNTIKYYADLADGNKATVLLQHSSGGSSTTYTLTTNETIPENISLVFENGAILDGAGTLTINGPVSSSSYQIFGDNLTVNGSPKISDCLPEWFGAKGDGVTDDTTAIQNSINFYTSVLFNHTSSGFLTEELTLVEDGVYHGSGSLVASSGDSIFTIPQGADNITIDGLT